MITTISSVNSHHFLSVQFTQSCLTLCNPMDCSTPGFLVHQQLPEPTQTYAHCISDAIRQSYPLSSLSPPAFNLARHQGLQMSQFFTSGGQNIRVLVGSPCSPRDSQESSPTPQFKSINSLELSFLLVQLSHPYMTTGKILALTT